MSINYHNYPVKNRLPRVLIVGPGMSHVGGVATFTEMLLSSAYLKERYTLLHLDISRDSRGAGLISRFALINLVYFARQVVNLIAMVIKYRPEIIHLPITSFWAFWKEAAFMLVARVFGIKVVAHLHGGLFHQYYRQRSGLEKRLIGQILRSACAVIALSASWKIFLLDEVRSDLKVIVVPNSVDPLFSKVISTLPNATPRDPNLILFVGRLGHHKGVQDILRSVPMVLEQAPKTVFAFAGMEENPSEWENIQQIKTEIDHTDSVQFLGQVTGQAKLDLFLKASIFLLPSYGENLPYALLEAMAAGLPVITTPVGAIPEIIEEGKNGFLIEPGDFKALADRITYLLDNPSLCENMSAANIDLIKKKFLPETAMARFDQIYSQLLALGNHKRPVSQVK